MRSTTTGTGRSGQYTMLISPVTYQGGKSRLPSEIVYRMQVPAASMFYDLCCGSGAVSIALIEAGHDPSRVVMVDAGPWGMFWQAIGTGRFDCSVFAGYCEGFPKDPREIKAYLKALSLKRVSDDGVYVFLLLQAGAFGGSPVAIKDDRWVCGGFRDYWVPTATSSRRSHVNPMMPMPDTIAKRVTEVTKRMRGIRGVHRDASAIVVEREAVVYIDPPYAGTSGYGHEIDVVTVAKDLGCPTWVSEGRGLSEQAILLSAGRSKGGMTGSRKCVANQEWLSYFGPT
jgi:hypothetical protein